MWTATKVRLLRHSWGRTTITRHNALALTEEAIRKEGQRIERKRKKSRYNKILET